MLESIHDDPATVGMIIEYFKLEMGYKLLASPYFDHRMTGINNLIFTINQVRKKEELEKLDAYQRSIRLPFSQASKYLDKK
jgi:hypothetical protein